MKRAFPGLLALLPAVALADPAHAPGRSGPAGPDAPFRPPADETVDDARLLEGTIQVTLRDPSERPLAGTPVTLGVIQQSVAKGESRKHLSQTTDANGVASFVGLENGSGIAYRVSVAKDGGSFAAMPFQMREKRGMSVTLHVYPVAHGVQDVSIFTQGAILVDVKDDRVQIQQAFRVTNYGPVAWVPENVTVDLPETFAAFNSAQEMSDQGWDSAPKGARLRGTFAAGESDVGYSWQLPYSGAETVTVEVSLPPKTKSMIVRAPASGPVRLHVDGFPDAQPQQDEEGNRILVTGDEVEPGQLKRVKITITGLPTPGVGRWVATSFATLGIALGLAFAAQRREKPKSKGKGGRATWLLQLEQLERARAEGDIGPKTYERARREIIDGLARTFADKKPPK